VELDVPIGNLFPNKMDVNFNMLGAGMVDWIGSQSKSL
jgi:hypothetical protein